MVYTKGFKAFLQLEKSLSENSVFAYLRDVERLKEFLDNAYPEIKVNEITLNNLQDFIVRINNLGLSATSQARMISGIKGFFKYLVLEDAITKNPAELLESPGTGRKLPDTLSVHEIDKLIQVH
jgi:integrase/recombinase XerD